MKELDIKSNNLFGGKVVRKDLTNMVKGNTSIPNYVLEYLLGQYCATNDPQIILDGVESVKGIISKHFVYREEREVIKFQIKDKGFHKIIDKVSVKLNDKMDCYEASFDNLGLNRIPLNEQIVKDNKKLLTEGVWCLATLAYQPREERDASPWIVEQIKPIQVSNIDMDEYKAVSATFGKEEWIDLLMQTIGLNPAEYSFRSKLIQLTRLIPYVENNYNLIELGPKGTGKTHVFSEFSPHGIVVSGSEVSAAKLFINMSTGQIGMVGFWDVIAFDEFAGKGKKGDRVLVDILKNYMANKAFSRGTSVVQAEASMVYLGNTDNTVPYMLKHTDLFEALPKEYHDSAFLDRMHCFLPGWETKKLRNELFTKDYGFIVDYLAEALKELRKEDHSSDYKKYFELSDSLITRDKQGIEKTFSGLVKLIYPHGVFDENDAHELMQFAIEGRKRVKNELMKIDPTYNEVISFSYSDKSGKTFHVETLEVLEFGDSRLGVQASNTEILEVEEKIVVEKTVTKKNLEPIHKQFRDNQSNVSYRGLFGEYLVGATDYVIRDPYIRLPYQLRNFMELCRLIAEVKSNDSLIKIHLITNNNEEYIENAKGALSEIIDSVSSLGIDLSYEFNDTLHDRSIEMNNGWKIILGRGLDIWQKTSGRYDIAEYYQEKRLCKEFEITVIKDSN
jgi:ATP-dependent Lon protease